MLVAVMELVLALAVSLLGVSLASPQAVINFAPIKVLLRLFPNMSALLLNQRTVLLVLLLGILIALGVKLLCSVYMYYRQGYFSQCVSRFVTYTLFEGYLYGPYLWHVRQETAVLQSHLKWHEYVSSFMMQFLLFISYFLITLLLLASILLTDPLVGSFVIVTTGGCGFLIYRWARRRVRRLNQETLDVQLGFNRITLLALQGIREILIYRQQQEFLDIVDDLNKKLCYLRPRFDMMPPLPALLLEIVGMAMLLISLLFMEMQGASLAKMTGTLTLMAAVAWRLLPVMNRFITSLLNAQAAMPYISPVLERIDEVQLVGGKAIVHALPCPLQRDITLQHVYFRYPETPNEQPGALADISLRIPRGNKVGFIGQSGAGKSTLVGLLTGLFVQTEGSIAVDGEELTPEKRVGWMKGIGYVPQSTFLLNATIAQNVAFSDWGKAIDVERVLASCKMAAMDFIHELPEGLNTLVGERGLRLSGGQVQRISIARALYNNPHTLILDEATSALDGKSEAEIMRTIDLLPQEITVVIVAHRLSTVQGCDVLYWMKNGRIVKAGNPQDIVADYETTILN